MNGQRMQLGVVLTLEAGHAQGLDLEALMGRYRMRLSLSLCSGERPGWVFWAAASVDQAGPAEADRANRILTGSAGLQMARAGV